MFVNPDPYSPEADFHLQEDSPCIDAGTGTNAPVPDNIDGDRRPQGGGFDVGADEFPVPGWNPAPMALASTVADRAARHSHAANALGLLVLPVGALLFLRLAMARGAPFGSSPRTRP